MKKVLILICVCPLLLFAGALSPSDYSLVMGGTQPSCTPVTVDLWEDFEFDGAVDATALASRDHNAGGTWTVSDGSSRLSTSTSGEWNITSCPNGESDASGTRGLAYSHTSGNDAYCQYVFASSPGSSAVSYGWRQTVITNTGNIGDWTTLRVQSSAGAVVAFVSVEFTAGIARAYLHNGTAPGSFIGITKGSNYWFTVSVQRNASSTLSVYTTNSVLVGSSTVTAADISQDRFQFGSMNSRASTGEFSYYDDLLIDYTDATFPLGP